MKRLSFLGLLILLSMINLGHASDFKKFEQKIDYLSHAIEQQQDNEIFLFQVNKALLDDIKTLESCVNQENIYLNNQNKQIGILKNIKTEPEGLDLRNKGETVFKTHQDKLYLCQYFILKVNQLIHQTEIYNSRLFLKSLFHRDEAYKQIIKHQSQLNLPNTKLVLSYIAIEDNIKRYLIALLTTLIILICIHFLKKSRTFLFLFHSIDEKKVFYAINLYLVTAPIIFLILHIIYFQTNEILRFFYARPVTFLFIYIYITGLYLYAKVKSYPKDFMIIISNLLCIFFALVCSINLSHLKELTHSEEQILMIKYWILIALQPVQFSILYWYMPKILNFKLTHKGLKVAILTFLIGIFIAGLFGYRNLAAHVNFLVIINTLYIGYFIIYTRIFKSIKSSIKNHQSKFYKFVQKHYIELTANALLSIKLFFMSLYIIIVIYIFISIFVVSIPYFSEYQLQEIYEFIFTTRSYQTINFSISKLVVGFLLFNLLNLINYLVSRHLAYKFYQDQATQYKTRKVFIGLGYVINFILVILVFNIHIENIGWISGAFFIGVGVAFQSSLSKMFTSLILFMNPPFRIGDYIEVQQTKGYVKKISFLETFIETSDNNTIIIPNQIIATSTIENFNFDNKSFQKIHINYILKNLDTQKEELIKIKLYEILHANDQVIEEKHYPIKFIFSLFSQTADSSHLEIIFCYSTKSDPKQELSQLSREIAEALKSINIDATFENIQFPYT